MHRPNYDDPGEFVFLRKVGTFAPSRIRIVVNADSDISTVLDEFRHFLAACGFHVPNRAVLDFVDEVTGSPLDGPLLDGTIESDGTTAEEFD